ncbi:nucleotide exchange factor GrpE [Evansella sp. LMS18]|uniref:nucleotide exchange factor GrpE n=1 Tax=Evansella sp. LMS18 TaxID=2924033 RepID=UPI0020D16052|nr:nucleotide exchange factor GrpE [Evansella sp. LMS18]UTR09342.1 nucleotide exchange factor GrpE [Evansella sp. LMS18]
MENKNEINKEDLEDKVDEEASAPENAEEPFDTEVAEEETAGEEAVPESEEDNNTSSEKELEAKLEESNNRLLRLHADYENFRRRTRQEKEADAKYRSQRLAEELLPAIDNFERALKTEIESEEAKNLMAGVEMVYRQLKDALKKEGVEEIEAVGKPFDPNYHQAVMQVEEEGFESNTVVEELQKGYMLKDRVIRPAMVKVNS